MSSGFLAFLVALGGGIWFYYKMAKRSGSGNLKPAVIGGVVVGIILMIIVWPLLAAILKK